MGKEIPSPKHCKMVLDTIGFMRQRGKLENNFSTHTHQHASSRARERARTLTFTRHTRAQTHTPITHTHARARKDSITFCMRQTALKLNLLSSKALCTVLKPFPSWPMVCSRFFYLKLKRLIWKCCPLPIKSLDDLFFFSQLLGNALTFKLDTYKKYLRAV